MNILITGINGFVGSNFTKKWSRNHALYGLDINQNPANGVKRIFSWNELENIPNVDAIIHLAGKAHDTKNQSFAQTYFDINTELTKKIFDYFLQSEANTFIFFSSVKAAADTVIGKILTEDAIPKPVGPYGESKIKAEEYILANSQWKRSGNSDSEQPIANGKNIYILRPCMIHGAGNKGNLNLLYNVVKKGIPWPLGAYENRRSFCSIDNVSFVVEQLILQQNVENGIYNVGDDEALSTNELIRLMSDSLGKKARIWKLPKSLIGTMAKIGGLLHLSLTQERLQKLTENYVVSNQKIKDALGISKMPLSAKDGMRRTIESFR